jgi:ATP-dependent Lon protease
MTTPATKVKVGRQSQQKLPDLPETLPVLPIRDQVIFPNVIVPLIVGREKSVRAVEQASERGGYLVMVAQRSAEIDDPDPSSLFNTGTVGRVVNVLRLPNERDRIIVEGLARVRILEWVQTEPLIEVRVQTLAESAAEGPEVEALVRSVRSLFDRALQIGKAAPQEATESIRSIEDPGRLADLVASLLSSKIEEKQEILEALNPVQRLEKLLSQLNHEVEVLDIERRIHGRVRKELEDTQKEFYLRERMKAIQQELGERDERMVELDELKEQIQTARMPKDVEEKALKELDRLEKMPTASPEVVVVRTYLDWLIALPWSKRTDEKPDISEAHRILEEDHYGLKRVKERILEYLAVRKLNPEMKGPILCFVGPPGTGKTSMGKSIARATGRKFIRISLGGVRDEGEIRGHRRTYVGALPGRILQGMRNVAFKNPVFMMDEVDKIGIDFRGDPAAALLEVLDPEQNNSFSDHYLEVPFDLSEVMFITTANFLDPVPPALKDRMEVIEFPGYIEEEKLKIAQVFLVPKQLKENGLARPSPSARAEETEASPTPRSQTEGNGGIKFTDLVIRTVIRNYTWEAGVRNLEREIATISRKIAKDVAQGKKAPTRVTPSQLHGFLGPVRFRFGVAEKQDEIGVATGLGATQVGGDVMSVEVTLMKGKGNLTLTGHLGDVMQESAKAAFSYTRSRAKELGIDDDFYRRTDVHIHVPAGQIPKDGPSAGITMATSLISALTKKPVRKDVAMTGEVTLRGKVLPVGAIKEKVLAAHRAGISTVILPRENEKDLEEIPQHVRRDLDIHFVENMEQVLKVALQDGVREPAHSATGQVEAASDKGEVGKQARKEGTDRINPDKTQKEKSAG